MVPTAGAPWGLVLRRLGCRDVWWILEAKGQVEVFETGQAWPWSQLLHTHAG